MTTGEVLHIHCHAEPDQRQHTLTGGCWCHPYTLRLSGNRGVVVDHNGQVRPGVLDPLEPLDHADSRGNYSLPRDSSCTDCGEPITGLSSRCLSCATREHWRKKKAGLA